MSKQTKIPVKQKVGKKQKIDIPKTKQIDIREYSESDYTLDKKGNPILKVSSLAKSSKDTYRNTILRLDRNGITLTEAKKMSNDELKKAIKSEGSDAYIKAFRRNLEQISKNSERRNLSVDLSVKQVSKNANLNEKQVKEVKKRLVKVSGNVFAEVVDILAKEYKGNTMKEIQLQAKELLDLSIDDNDFNQLDDFEKDIVIEYAS